MTVQNDFMSSALAAEVAELLHKRHQAALAPGEHFKVSGEVDGDHAYASVLLENADRSFSYKIEAALRFQGDGASPAVASAETARGVMLDLLDLHLGEFFEKERRETLPKDWGEHEVAPELSVLVRGTRRNALLEGEADRFLRESGFEPNGDPMRPAEGEEPS